MAAKEVRFSTDARDRLLAPDVRQQLLRQARELGFDVASLIWVEQTRDDG